MPALKRKVREQMLARRGKGGNLPVRMGGKQIRPAVEPAGAPGAPAPGPGAPAPMVETGGMAEAPRGRIDMGPPPAGAPAGGMPPTARPVAQAPTAPPAAPPAAAPVNAAVMPAETAAGPGAGRGAGLMAPGGSLRARFANTAGAPEQGPGQGLGPMAGRFAPPAGQFIQNWMRGRKKVPTRRPQMGAGGMAGGFR